MMKIYVAFITGALLYSILEVIWRGYTHWTMALTAGICMAVFYVFNLMHGNLYIWQKSFVGALIITIAEFSVGCITNLKLGWNIWNYGNMPFNLYGQICLLYSAYWFLISIPMIFICEFIKSKVII